MWDIWKEYIDSVFQIMFGEGVVNNHRSCEYKNNKASVENSPEKAHCSHNDTETIDDSPEKAHEFICRVIEDSSRNGKYSQNKLTIYLEK